MNSDAPPVPSLDPLEEAIFNTASELTDSKARGKFLERSCGNDIALKQRIETLLQAHYRAIEFLKDHPLDLAKELDSSVSDILPRENGGSMLSTQREGTRQTIDDHHEDSLDAAVGQSIGRYKILEKIGEGGCGVVYVAEQIEPVRRRVALKVIKLGMDTKAVVARFEAERQALAMMDHPNIAKVHDGGATDTGRPFFVMELVRGIRITDYCDENMLPAKERLNLFIKVCQAIQHAHQKGIIHRDIKPSNILVTLLDGVPVPKVIDFGIAKATEGRLTDATIYTQLHQFIGTPAYMSPEQAEMSGLDIDTRSDIYSLGVLLYELLAGSTPFSGKELMEVGIDEMRKTIREKEPMRPSTRLATLNREEQTTAAKRRRIHAPELIHLLKGDLDWIVMKALEKDRTRRYETANGLGADIQRHLGNEPVVARPPSNLYRFHKFVRRNKLVFAGTTAFATVVVIGFFIFIYLFVREKSARKRAEIAENQQSLERRRAEGAQALAEANAEKARAEAVRSRRSQYAADMIATESALQAGNYGRAREMLRQYFPSEGEEELRGFEWRHWWKLSEGEQLQSFASTGQVFNIAWSPDGRLIAAANSDHTVKLLKSDTGEVLSTLTGHTRRVVSVAFSFDGKGLATAADDGRVHFWDVRDSSLIFTVTNRYPRVACSPTAPLMAIGTDGDEWGQRGGDVQLVDTRSGQTIRVLSKAGNLAVFSPNGKFLVSANGVDHRTVILWNVAAGKELQVLENMPQTLGMAFSPHGGLVAIADRQGQITVWNLLNYQRTILRQSTGDFARSVSFSKDGLRLVSGMQTHDLEMWGLQDQRQIARLRGNAAQVWSVAFSPDGTQLASGCEDGTVRIWDPNPPAVQKLIPGVRLHPYMWVGHPRFSPDSRYLAHATAHMHVELVDPTTPDWAVRSTLTNAGFPAVFSADSKTLITTDHRAFYRWHVASSKLISTTPLNTTNGHWLYSAVTSDGSRFALATDDLIEIFNPGSGDLIDSFKTPVQARNVEFSPDGKVLAICGAHGSAALWDIAGRRVAQMLKGHKTTISSLRFSPDQKTIATSSWDGQARLWDAATGKQLTILAGHKAGLLSCLFSPDGRTLVTGSDDRTMRFWNVATFREIASFQMAGSVFFLGFSPDGQILAANNTDKYLRAWHGQTLKDIEAAGAK